MYSGTFVLKRFVSLLAIPILVILSVGLCICAVIAIVGGLLYTFGVDVRMEFLPGLSLPLYLGLPAGILFGAFLLAITFLSLRLLKYVIASWKI